MMRKQYKKLILIAMLSLLLLLLTSCNGAHFTVQYNASEGGQIIGETVQSIQAGKDTTAVTAEPNKGFEFIGWSDGVKTATRLDESVSQNLNVTAEFKVKEYTLTYLASEYGEVSGLPNQTIAHGNDAYFAIAIPHEGCDFLGWSDGVKTTARRDLNVQSDITVTAMFKLRELTVTYRTNGNGRIEGKTSQTVKYGHDAEVVTAIPNEGYYFYCWSDDDPDPVRKDINVKQNIDMVARFVILKFNISYSATDGGHIEGFLNQTMPYGSTSSTVQAIADEGYEFVGWSDGVLTASRTEYNIKADCEVTAIFQKKQFHLLYGAHTGGKIEGNTEQIVCHNQDAQSVTAIADDGYEFLCWSDGITTTTRHDKNLVIDKDVRAVFVTNDTPVFKLMMVYATELHVNLQTADGEWVRGDYIMSEAEVVFFEMITQVIRGYLNDAFAGKVKFVVDSYFTTEPITNDQIQWGQSMSFYSYGLMARDIPELKGKLNQYNSFLTTFSMNDYDGKLHNVAGSAGKKYGYVHAEDLFWSYNHSGLPIENLLNFGDDSVILGWTYFMELYLHEFSHTVEMGVEGTIGLHNAMSKYSDIHGSLTTKLKVYMITMFLKDELEFEGGIPFSFWENSYLSVQ